jgi:hypothetical protein
VEPFVDILAAATYLNVKISWVYEQVRLDRMPSSKVGHRRRFRLCEAVAVAFLDTRQSQNRQDMASGK